MSDTLSGVLRSTVDNNGNVSKVKSNNNEKPENSNQYPKLDPGCFELLPLTDSQEDQLISEMQNDTNFDDLIKTLSMNKPVQGPQPSGILPVSTCNTVNMQSTMSTFQSFAGLPMIHNYGTININYSILPK